MRGAPALLLFLMSLPAVVQTPAPRLLEVSFAGGRDIERDDGSGPYAAPHWRTDAREPHPYLMKAGATLAISNAKVQVPGMSSGSLVIRGTREDALHVPPTAASKVTGTTDVYQIA